MDKMKAEIDRARDTILRVDISEYKGFVL